MKEITDLTDMALRIVEQAQATRNKNEIQVLLKSTKQIINQIKEQNDRNGNSGGTPQ